MPKKRILISSRETPIGRVDVYEEFDGAVQKMVLTNEKNISNYRTITKFISGNSSSMIVKSRLELGDTYVSYSVFDKNGECVELKKSNRKKGTVYRMEIILSNEKGQISVIDYNGEKSVTFVLKNIRENVRIQQPKGLV